MSVGRSQDILIGPRTTVWTLLQAYPFLEPFLLARVRGFEALADEGARTRWARVMTLDDVAVRLNVPWQQLVREICGRGGARRGRPPRVADGGAAPDRRRLSGGSASCTTSSVSSRPAARCSRWRSAGAPPRPTSSRRSRPRWTLRSRRRPPVWGAAGARAVEAGAEAGGTLTSPPPGHPLETLRREAGQVARWPPRSGASSSGLAVLPRGDAGGRRSPCRAPGRAALGRGAPLPPRAAGVAACARGPRRRRPPCAARGAPDGDARDPAPRAPGHAVERDDSASVAEAGGRLVDALEDLLAQDERLLEPLALRHFSPGDWAAVRELEDGVGWGLISSPPAWPNP